MHDYMRLEVVKRARRLIPVVYRATVPFPVDERFLLVSQMRGCAHSMGANLAEGAGRNTKGEFRQFVGHAIGSAYELEWHILIAWDLGYLDPQNRDALLCEVVEMKKMLYAFRESLR